MEKKRNGPRKGAGKRFAAKLKELGQQPPPQDLVDKINGTAEKRKIASPFQIHKDINT